MARLRAAVVLGAAAKTPLTPGVSCPGGAIGAIFLPDPYSGRFDNLGAFMQPAQLTLNLQTSYEIYAAHDA